MKYAYTIIDTIGNTPLVRLNTLTKDIAATVLVKVESFNPGGSSKDRIGITMIESAEKRGLLKPGNTIVEPTSGNTGLGLAMVAAIKGYKTIFVMPDKVSIEKELLLRAYNAEVIRTPTDVEPEDARSYYSVAKRLSKEIPDAYLPMQYSNPDNPLSHYQTTGPEIWEDTAGKITHFVAGMGTGGTISGVGKFLKEQNPDIKIIGADPEGSLYHHYFYKTEGEVHGYKVEGIGEDFIPEAIDLSLIDDVITVQDADAIATTRALVSKEAILAGSSSGAAVWATLQIAKELSEDAVVVTLLPDTGRNYMGKYFNDQWLKEHNFI